MYLKIHRKKIEIIECSTFMKRFKSLKFVIDPIDYGIVLPKRKLINTYFFCQRVDCIVTNKEGKIIKIYPGLYSEKMKFIFRAHSIYYLPLNSSSSFQIGEELKIEKNI